MYVHSASSCLFIICFLFFALSKYISVIPCTLTQQYAHDTTLLNNILNMYLLTLYSGSRKSIHVDSKIVSNSSALCCLVSTSRAPSTRPATISLPHAG